MYPMKGVRNHHRKFVMYLKDQEGGLQEDQHRGRRKGRETASANLGFRALWLNSEG